MNARFCAKLGTIPVVLAAAAMTVNAPGGEPTETTRAKEPLKEILRFPSNQFPTEKSLREHLAEGAINNLGVLEKRKNETSVLVRANCEVGRERVRRYAAGAADDYPLMLAASSTIVDDSHELLWLWNLNLSRETELVVLEGTTSTGDRLRAVYHYHSEYKSPELVSPLARFVDRIGPQEFLRLGRKVTNDTGTEIHLDVPVGKLPIPDMHPLVAAIVDRQGRTSNFVEVAPVPRPASKDDGTRADEKK